MNAAVTEVPGAKRSTTKAQQPGTAAESRAPLPTHISLGKTRGGSCGGGGGETPESHEPATHPHGGANSKGGRPLNASRKQKGRNGTRSRKRRGGHCISRSKRKEPQQSGSQSNQSASHHAVNNRTGNGESRKTQDTSSARRPWRCCRCRPAGPLRPAVRVRGKEEREQVHVLWIMDQYYHSFMFCDHVSGRGRDGESGGSVPTAAGVWGQSERGGKAKAQGCAKKRRRVKQSSREGEGGWDKAGGFGFINKCRRSGRALTHFAVLFLFYLCSFFLTQCSLTVLEARPSRPSFDPPGVTFGGSSAAPEVITFGN
jgi:hypothetical protein